MLSDNIIIGLHELSRNMDWLNGCALIWLWQGIGLNLGETKLNFLFVKISFGMNVKKQRKTLAAKRGWKITHNEPLNGNYQPL